ncbi:MAG: hypothetical protein IJM61_00830 [Firmicutes bacterium]|nr:hypothetical protein [Bacillota bacterium]
MITVNIYYTGRNGSACAFTEEMVARIAALRGKYDLHMKVERFDSSGNGIPEKDREFIR